MPANEPIQGGPYPLPTEDADGPNNIQAVVEWAADRTVMRFSSPGERDQLLTNPQDGMLCATGSGSSTRLWHYANGAWRLTGDQNFGPVHVQRLDAASVISPASRAVRVRGDAILKTYPGGIQEATIQVVIRNIDYPAGQQSTVIGRLAPALRPGVGTTASAYAYARTVTPYIGDDGTVTIRYMNRAMSGLGTNNWMRVSASYRIV